MIGDSKSGTHFTSHGVPQGSVVGPLAFSLYAAPIQDVITHHDIKCMMYADDTQMYIILKNSEQSNTVSRLQACVVDIISWSTQNGLKLNSNKTEILHFTSKFRNCNQIDSINIDNTSVKSVNSARNLGVHLDRILTMTTKINNVCKSS